MEGREKNVAAQEQAAFKKNCELWLPMRRPCDRTDCGCYGGGIVAETTGMNGGSRCIEPKQGVGVPQRECDRKNAWIVAATPSWSIVAVPLVEKLN